MRTLMRILVALVVTAAGVGGLAYLLPPDGEVRAVTTIAAPPSAVYALAADLGRFGAWSPWPEFGPDVQTMLSGPAGAEGQTLSWISEDPALGTGTLTLTALDAGRRVAAEIDFGGAVRANSVLTLEATAGGTRAEWAFATDLRANPLHRYVWVMSGVRAILQAQLRAGLARLADLAERPQPGQAPSLAPVVAAAPLAPAIIMPPLASSPLPVVPLTAIPPGASIGP